MSEGKRSLRKVLQFQQIENTSEFNLALGTLLENGDVDFETLSRNGDLLKVMGTVLKILIEFLNTNQNAQVLILASDELRNRSYHIILWKFAELMNENFDIFGVVGKNGIFQKKRFRRTQKYLAFVIQKKLI